MSMHEWGFIPFIKHLNLRKGFEVGASTYFIAALCSFSWNNSQEAIQQPLFTSPMVNSQFAIQSQLNCMRMCIRYLNFFQSMTLASPGNWLKRLLRKHENHQPPATPRTAFSSYRAAESSSLGWAGRYLLYPMN